METLKVAISGVGGQGQNHIRTFRAIPETELVGLYDVDTTRAKTLAACYEVPRAYETLEDLLHDDDIDILAIAAPCPYHGEQTLLGLNAGKHVLVEVGVDGFDLDRLWRIVKAAEQTGLKVQVGNHHRWDPTLLTMRRLVDDGKIGELFYAEGEYLHDLSYLMGAESDGTATWRNGFGKLPQPSMSSGGGIHAIDTIRWLMGGVEFVEVQGYGNRICMPWRDVDDLEVALFKTQSGAVAKVSVAKGIKRPMSTAYSIYGTVGSAERPRHERMEGTVDPDEQYILHGQNPGPVSQYPPMLRIAVSPHDLDPALVEAVGHGGLTYLLFRDFVEAILENRQPQINVYEAARSSAAGICAWRAIQEGRSIKIPSIPDRSADFKRYRTLWGSKGVHGLQRTT